MKFIRIYFIIFILWKEILAERSAISLEKLARTDYFYGFVNYLKNESKLYRVVFILQNKFENPDPMLNSLIKEVNQHFPSISRNYNDIETWSKRIYEENFKGGMNYRSSTLFVFEANNHYTMTSIKRQLENINIGTESALPRCLIMNSFNSTQEYLNITLLSLWESHYLDITIMTYSQNHGAKPFLSHINPFTKTFTAFEITPKIQWFPDKLKDLKGQRWGDFYFKVFNQTGDINQEWWMTERILEIFSKATNSELTVKYPKKIEPFLSLQVYHPVSLLFCKFILRIQKIESLKAIIPRTEKMSNEIAFSPELLSMIMITICMIVIILLAAFFLNFNKTTWSPLNMSQVIIGMPANQEPNKWIERIVFGSLLITCIVYTGYFYSVILDISLQPVPEISTLEELADSSLNLTMDFFTYKQMEASISSPLWEKISAKSLIFEHIYNFQGIRCLEYLDSYKNISCFLPDAENQVNEYFVLKGKALKVKILPEIVAYQYRVWSNFDNPPFTDFFSKIILRATEFGLFDKFYSTSYVLPGEISPPEEIKKEKLFFLISYVLGIGYCFSIVCFLFELFIRNFSDRAYNLYARFRLGN